MTTSADYFSLWKTKGHWNKRLLFTSDHRCYQGDQWMGDKDWFHEPSTKIPLIVRDPSPLANFSQGSRSTELVESIDLIQTFIEALGGSFSDHILGGKSLKSLLHSGSSEPIREWTSSEYDYSIAPISLQLNADPNKHAATWSPLSVGNTFIMSDMSGSVRFTRGSYGAKRFWRECWILQNPTRIKWSTLRVESPSFTENHDVLFRVCFSAGPFKGLED